MTMGIIITQTLLLLTVVVPFNAYNKICPHNSQKKFRSHSICTVAHQRYSCFLDTNGEDYMEYCNKPDFSAPGEYYVFTGSRRNIECTNTTYQPFSLWSNESTRCEFKKSLCTQNGQVLYKLGSTTEDSQCRCDYTKRYAFVITPARRCFCIPSEEDCSCHIKQCGFGYVLNADYRCKLQSQRIEERCEAIGILTIPPGGPKSPRDNLSDPTIVSKSEKSVIPTMILISVVLLIILGLCLLAIKCNCENENEKSRLNESECSRTDLISPTQDLLDSPLQQFNEEFKPDSPLKQLNQELKPDTPSKQINQGVVTDTDKSTNFKVVAAIDVGSTSSWYGSSTVDMFKIDPLNMKVDIDYQEGGSSYLAMKTATCILMKKDGSFISLGHRAKDEYAEILLDGKADLYLFFDKFKMDLYNKKDISDVMLIQDVKGCKRKAIDVFSSFIYELMERVVLNYKDKGIKFDDILWVLTVPAVWSEKAKTFMRQCAVKKGVQGNRLIIALEPEVVSVYFQYLHKYQPTEIPKLDRKYVVVDIGGGTVDITAHETTDDGDLIELCKSAGDDIGGREVDENFLKMFGEIVGDLVMNSLKTDNEYMDSYFDISKEIERFKRKILASEKPNLFFNIPFSNLDSLCQKHYRKSLRETIESSEHFEEISLKGDKIIFLRKSLLTLFQPVGERISTKIRQVMKELKDVDMMLLAGGLSMSPVIVKIIKETFESMTIIQIPSKYPADLAVVRGAVLYGHHPHMISSRITEYTYGRVVQPAFDPQNHDETKLINVHGTDLCKDVFDILVPKNTRVNVDEIIRKEYKTINESQKKIRIAVYITKKDKVKYVDDAECELFCEVMVPLTESQGQPSCVVVDFIFGFTEFHVTAREKETGFEYKVSVELK